MAKLVGTYTALEFSETYDAMGYRTAVLSDPESPDSITIVEQPSVGRAIARSDGKITLNLLDEDPAGDITFVYDRTIGGTTEQVTATVTVAAATSVNGWGLGDYYLPRVDHSTNKVVVEPSQNTRKVYVADDASGGLTAAEIAALEGVSVGTITAAWLKNNYRTGTSEYYGETESYPLVFSLAEDLFVALQENDTNTASPWLLFKRGDTFVGSDMIFSSARGYSALHPIYTGAWGNSEDPVPDFDFGTGLTKNLDNPARFLVWQDNQSPGRFYGPGPFSFSVFDGVSFYKGGYDFESTASNYHLRYNNTFRRMKITDAYKDTPKATDWGIGGSQEDRHAGLFVSEAVGTLFQDMFVDLAGWNIGYRMDGSGSFPQAPSEYSHCFYIQHGCLWQTYENIGTARGAATGIQARSGGAFYNIVNMDSQVQLFISNGGYSEDGLRRANYSMVDHYLGTVGGYKAFYTGGVLENVGYTKDGIRTAAPDTGVDRTLIINDDLARMSVATSSTDIGPATIATPNSAVNSYRVEAAGSWFYRNMQVANWDLEPDENVDGVLEATIDGTTAGAFHDEVAATAGSDYMDLINRWRSAEQPWQEFEDFIRWGRGRMGNDVTVRTTPTTVYFRPNVNSHTPGNRYDIRLDWSTLDLPGDVNLDSVHLDGHVITWNQTPKNSIVDFTFGVGGGLRVTGVLDVTGDIITSAGGHPVDIYNGGQFITSGYADTNVMDVQITDGRFLNYGIVTGGFDITARWRAEAILGYDDASFTLASGRTLTVYGGSLVGFDGAAGGSASLTLAAGSTLAFKPTARVTVGNVPTPLEIYHGAYPHIGATISNGSGATGVVREWQYRGSTKGAGNPIGCDAIYTIDDVVGTFSAADSITADDHFAKFAMHRGSGAVGTASSVTTHTLGQIAEFRSGINGFTAPNVASAVTLGGTLHLDVTGVPNGDYDLIIADTVSGVFSAVTGDGYQVSGDERDLTISITGTTVSLNIADAAAGGAISGGTS